MHQLTYQCGLRAKTFSLEFQDKYVSLDIIRREISKQLLAPTQCIALTKLNDNELLLDEQTIELPMHLQTIILPLQRINLQVIMGDGKYSDFQFDDLDIMEDFQQQVQQFIENTYQDYQTWKYELKYNDQKIDFQQYKNQQVCNYFKFQENIKVDAIIIRERIELIVSRDAQPSKIIIETNKTLQQLKEELQLTANDVEFIVNGNKNEEFNERKISQVLSHQDTLTIVQVVK